MTIRKQYIKPMALNLSGFGVVGQEPLGVCANGTMPTVSNCPGGEQVEQNPMFCSPNGILPDWGDCNPSGGNVVSGCSVGSLHT